MHLGDLLPVPVEHGAALVNVTRVDIDSRTCQPGSVFFAMPGTATHGQRFIEDAVAHGAVAVVSSEPVATSVPVVVVPRDQLHQADRKSTRLNSSHT